MLKIAIAMTVPDLDAAVLQDAVAAAAGGTPVMVRNARITEEQMTEIVSAAPLVGEMRELAGLDASGSRLVGEPDLAEVSFKDDAVFTRAVFEGDARFAGARFGGEARFERVVVEGDARFSGAAFERAARFDHAVVEGDLELGDDVVFGGEAAFSEAAIRGQAKFGDAQFEKDARFNRVTVGGDAWFYDARFAGDVWFDGATFEQDAWFGNVRFCKGTWFGGTSCGGQASFLWAAFEQARDVGPILAADMVSFQGADFHVPVRIKVVARRASWEAARFRAGVDLSVRRAQVTLQRAEFGGPSVLAALPPGKAAGSGASEGGRSGATGYAPALVSVRGAKLADLSLSEVDLRRCAFNGASGLAGLQLERVRFATSPRTSSLRWPWRWTPRQTIAEEHHWRRERGDWGWGGYDTKAPDWIPAASEAPTAEQLVSIYRALRKGREDIKDEPGAADFYYGEMEMRRQADPRSPGFAARAAPPAERWLVGLYWLVSGYALRSSRALAALAIVLVVFAALFELFGFEPRGVQTRVSGVSAGGELLSEEAEPPERTTAETAVDAVTFSAATAASVLSTAPSRPLTRTGEVLRVLLRILGPILVGLALLSFRGRVKR